MMGRFRTLLSIVASAFVLTALPAFVATAAHAEGSEPDTPAPAKVHHKRAKAKPKAAPAEMPKMNGPVPYTVLTPAQGKAQPVTPGPATVATTPDGLPQPAETNKALPQASDVAIAPRASLPAPPPPPPPPAMAAVPSVAPTVAEAAEISLRCETQVTKGTRVVTSGVFFIDLFPSAVFPDEHADFKFLFVDPAHKSLIRDSICLDAPCPATVTGSAYYLVNQTTRHGNALRITLDRSKGAFYAEEIDQGVMGMFRRSNDAEHLGEKGFCTPQKLPNAMF